MKIKNLSILLAFASIFFLTSCGDDEAFTANPTYDETATGEKPNLPADTSSNAGGGNTGGGNGNQSMSYTLNGQVVTYTECTIDTSFYRYGIDGAEDLFSTVMPKSSISIYINQSDTSSFMPQVGTVYQLNDTSLFKAEYIPDYLNFDFSDTTAVYEATSGQIVFSKASGSTHEGTFVLDAKNSVGTVVNITGGTFKAEYE